MFSVGDKVMHCTHGAGIITEKKEMQITKTPRCYLVIQMLGSDSTLMIPIDKAEQRLRPARKEISLRQLLTDELASEPEKLPQDYKERTKHIESKLKSGETKKWIEIVRDLSHREEQGKLSSGDRRLLDRAIDLLSGELALAQEIGQEQAKTHLKSIVQRRGEITDRRVKSSNWWQTLGPRVMESLTKSRMDRAGDARQKS